MVACMVRPVEQMRTLVTAELRVFICLSDERFDEIRPTENSRRS